MVIRRTSYATASFARNLASVYPAYEGILLDLLVSRFALGLINVLLHIDEVLVQQCSGHV